MINYPRQVDENQYWRLKARHKAKHDVEFRSDWRELCRRDVVTYFNTMLYTYDTRFSFYEVADIPFILFPAQEDFVKQLTDQIQRGKNIALEKSRDEGATWMVLGVVHWYWNLGDGGNFLLGSINEKKLHLNGDMSTLFPKLFYFNDKLPSWMHPRGFNPKKHQSHLRLYNPKTKSTVSGETGKSFATSGRYRAVFMDELSKWESGIDDLAWEASQQTTNCRIAVATPFGRYGLFYRLVSNTTDTAIDKLKIHWTDDPRKTTDLEWLECPYSDYATSPAKNHTLYKEFKGKRSKTPIPGWQPTSTWYRDECLDTMNDPLKGDSSIRQELDIKYLGTGKTYFNDDLVEEMKAFCKPPIKKGYFERVNKKEKSDEWADFYNEKNEYVRFVEDNRGDWWIWDEPEIKYEKQFAVGVDTAKGLEDVNDFSVVGAMDRDTRKTFIRYVGRTEFIVDECEMLYEYLDRACVFNIDATGNNKDAIEADKRGLPLIDQVDEGKKKEQVSSSKGFAFNKKSKPLAFDRFRVHLKEKDFYDPDERLFLQMETFIQDEKGRLKGAGKGPLQSHDDIVDEKGLELYAADNMEPLVAQKYDQVLKKSAEHYNLIDDGVERGRGGRIL